MSGKTVQVSLLGWPAHWLQTLYFLWGWAIVALAVWHRRRESRGRPA